MPYKKFSKKYPRASRALNVATQALSIAKSVASVINVEWKHIDSGVNTITPGTAGTVVSLNHLAEGVSSNERTGISIKMKSLELRGNFTMDATATNTILRLIVILDNSPNSDLATIAEMFEVGNVETLRNNVNFGRFKTLYDRSFAMSGTGMENGTYKKYIKLNNHVKYSGSDATEDGIEKGQLLFISFSNEATNKPSLKYNARVRYVDN